MRRLIYFYITACVGCVAISTSLAIFFPPRPFTPEAHPLWRISENPADRAYATLNNSRVTIEPSKATFTIPERWLEGWKGNIAVSKEKIEGVANGTYPNSCFIFANVANAAFPFDRCAASVSEWEWNGDGGAHLRVYDLAEPVEDAFARVEGGGLAEIRRLPGADPNPKVKRSQTGRWSRITISFSFSADAAYSSGMSFDFYAQQKHGRTFAFAFNNAQRADAEVLEILNSVAFSAGK